MNTGQRSEHPLAFPCEGETLLGVLHRPAASASPPVGVVIVVGGPQYRAGSHRQFVQVARALADAGHAVLRFDVRGMGDSTGSPRRFDQLTPDIAAAVDALQHAEPQVGKVVLWGLCDGASAALIYVAERRDARVGGLLLVNPWTRDEQSLARARLKHYYVQRALDPAFWRKLAQGGVGTSAFSGLLRHARQAITGTPGAAEPAPAETGPTSFQQSMLRGWTGFSGHIGLVLSGRDLVAQEFVEHTRADAGWRSALRRSSHRTRQVPAADHTFSDAEAAAALLQVTLECVAVTAGAQTPVSSPTPCLP